MSAVTKTDVYIFHTDLGPVLTQVETVVGYDVEDIIRNRALSQALKIRFIALGQAASPNTKKGARTITSAFSSNTEVLT